MGVQVNRLKWDRRKHFNIEHHTSYTLKQRFSIPVLAYPSSAHFVCFSYRFRRLFYWTVSALRSGHHQIFRHDSSRREHICSIQRALKCARREFKLYLFTEVYYVTLHASLVSFVCV